MMRTYYKNTLLFALISLVNLNFFGQETVSKNSIESHFVSNDSEVFLTNKYGDIELIGWKKDSLKIDVTIKVNHKKAENAQNLLNRIESSVKLVGNLIYIKTEVSDKNKSAFSRYFNKVSAVDFNKSNVQINYKIHVPEKIIVELSNKFGDVIVESFYGELNAALEHGDMWINQDIDKLKLALKYGNLKTKSITYGNINLKNAGLDIKGSKNLVVNSSGSSIEIEQVNNLELITSKDNVEIVAANQIRGEFNYSKIHIVNVQNSIDAYMKVTEFSVSKFNEPNTFINIEEESSDVSLNITGLSFDFKADLKEGVLKIPKTFENINSEVLDKSEKIRQVRATYGENPTGSITIKGLKGSIVFKDSKFN